MTAPHDPATGALDAAAREMFGNAGPDTITEAMAERAKAAAVVRAYLDALHADELSTTLFGGPSRDDEIARVLRAIYPGGTASSPDDERPMGGSGPGRRMYLGDDPSRFDDSGH